MKKQVPKSHYGFKKYVTKGRWASIWHQLDEVIETVPENVLEIGPGAGLFKAVGCALGLDIETLDIDPELNPDHIASVFELPFKDKQFDVVCAFQMLEHLPFDKSTDAFGEMVRVSKRYIIISLPDARVRWSYTIYLPRFGTVQFSVPKFWKLAEKHRFDGEHYWEIGKLGFSTTHVASALSRGKAVSLIKDYRVHDNTYHHFFVFEKR